MVFSPFWNYTRLTPETGTIDGYDWIIGDATIATTAYVRIPKDHPLYHKEAWRDILDERVGGLEVNGGCTYWAYTDDLTDPRRGCCIGWDYGHYWNDGRKLTREEVLDDVKVAIKFLRSYPKTEHLEKVGDNA